MTERRIGSKRGGLALAGALAAGYALGRVAGGSRSLRALRNGWRTAGPRPSPVPRVPIFIDGDRRSGDSVLGYQGRILHYVWKARLQPTASSKYSLRPGGPSHILAARESA